MIPRMFFLTLLPFLATPLQAAIIFEASDDGSNLTFQATGTFDFGSTTGSSNSDSSTFVSTAAFGTLDGSNFTASFVGSSTGNNPFAGNSPNVAANFGLGAFSVLSTGGTGFSFNGANAFWDDSLGASPGVISPTATWTIANETVASVFGAGLDNGPVALWTLAETGDTISVGLAVPEPSSLLLTALASIGLLRRRSLQCCGTAITQ